MSAEAQLEALLDTIVTSARQAITEYKKGGNEVPTIYSRTIHPLDFANDAIVLQKAQKLLEGACQQLCASLLSPLHAAINLAVPFGWASMHVAVRAKIADALENHPNGLHIDELAKLINAEKGKLARVLRLLVTMGCFIELKPNVFANNRMSLVTLSHSDTGALVKLMAEDVSKGAPALYETMTNPDYAASYHPERAPLIYVLKTKGIKGNFFDWMKEDAERRENFHRAMLGVSMGSKSVLHYYPWNEVKTVCDVGAGIGTISRPLAKMYPHLRITHQDLSEVLVQAKEVWAREAAEVLRDDRVEFVPLNFLEQSPVRGKDVYYLRQIVHDWPDDEAAIILKNVRKAMEPHSRLLIHGVVLPSTSSSSNASSSCMLSSNASSSCMLSSNASSSCMLSCEQFLPSMRNREYQQDMVMWIVHNSKERTLNELISLGTTAGLQLEKVYDLVEYMVLEFKATAT